MAVAIILVIAGGALVTAGAALIFPPAGLIVAGVLVAAGGWFTVDVGGDSR